MKSGEKEYSEVFYNYFFKIFNQYYGNIYNITAIKNNDIYTGEVTSDVPFFIPNNENLMLGAVQDEQQLSDAHASFHRAQTLEAERHMGMQMFRVLSGEINK